MVILHDSCFNPRTYIRYDTTPASSFLGMQMFQSTYLYKVRPSGLVSNVKDWINGSFNPRTYIRYDLVLPVTVHAWSGFQSTYLYKVRQKLMPEMSFVFCFNPRTYIRYDRLTAISELFLTGFNPRTYIRYDFLSLNKCNV